MRLYTLTESLTDPWSVAEAELNRVFGEPAEHDDEFSWTVASQLFSIQITLNRGTGRMEYAVSTRLPYRALAVVSVLLAVGVGVIIQESYLLGIPWVVCMSVGIFPLVSVWRFNMAVRNRIAIGASVEDINCTPAVLLPVAGLFIINWALASSTVFRGLTLLLSLFGLPICYAITSVSPVSLRSQLPLIYVAVFSSAPLMLTVANFGFVHMAIEQVGPAAVSPIVLVLSVLTISFLFWLASKCRMFVMATEEVPNRPVSTAGVRIIWSGYFLLLNLMMLASISIALSGRSVMNIDGTPTAVLESGFETSGLPFPSITAVGATVLLAMPVIVVVVFWIGKLTRVPRGYYEMYLKSEPVSDIGGPVRVRTVDSPQVLARPFRSPRGEETVMLSDRIVDELAPDELEAVVAHETYHLENRDFMRNLLTAIFGVLVGGRNVLIACFDYPKIERQADEYAVEQVGSEPLIRALRKLERIQSASVTQPSVTGRSSAESGSWLISAPYDILFGSALLENAHASVDERIEHAARIDG